MSGLVYVVLATSVLGMIVVLLLALFLQQGSRRSAGVELSLLAPVALTASFLMYDMILKDWFSL